MKTLTISSIPRMCLLGVVVIGGLLATRLIVSPDQVHSKQAERLETTAGTGVIHEDEIQADQHPSSERRTTVVFEDSFSRDGILRGTKADTGHNWDFATSRTSTDGEVLLINSGAKVAIEGIRLEKNSKYELTAEMTVEDGGHHGQMGWIAFGFSQAEPANGNPFTSGRSGTLLHRRRPKVDLYTTGETQTKVVPAGFPASYTIAIETGNDLSDSKISFSRDGKRFAGPFPTDTSAVSSIYIQSITGTTGKVDNLKLTAQLP